VADKNNNNNANVVDLRESYQPVVDKTYSPRVINGNYQPVIPTAVASQHPKPPIGDSGVPSARNSNGDAGAPTPSAKNSSSD